MTITDEPSGLLSELGLDVQNHATIGRLLGTGSIARASERADGTMEATIRIKEDSVNDDKNTHSALFPSNGDKKFLWLLNHSKGRAKLNLDGPGYYWYSSPGGNDEGRGLTAAIVVLGEVPPHARLDRPDQPRP
jgi:hypothetical protein